MSKLLKRLNDNQNKVADTNGIMKLQAWDYGIAQDLTNKQITATVANASGFLFDLDLVSNGTEIDLDFKDSQLQKLTPDTYFLEIKVTDKDGDVSVFPTEGYATFTINKNLHATEGALVPQITFDTVLADVKTAMDETVANYVKTIAKGDKGDTGPAGKDAEMPVIGGRNLILDTGRSFTGVGTNSINGNFNAQGGNYYLAGGKKVSDFYNQYGSSGYLTLSFDWVASGSTISGKLNPVWNNTPWGGLATTDGIQPSSTNKTGHYEITVPLKATGYSTGTATSIIFRQDNLQGNITISNVKLEAGNVATDWTPAPEDTQSDINKRAIDTSVVHNTGNETVAGNKTFTNSMIVNNSLEANTLYKHVPSAGATPFLEMNDTNLGDKYAIGHYYSAFSHGSGVTLGAGGLTIVGGGESAKGLGDAIDKGLPDVSASGLPISDHGNEHTVIAADGYIYFMPGQQSGYPTLGPAFRFSSSGYLDKYMGSGWTPLITPTSTLLAQDSQVVHNTGNETVAGNKTFSGNTTIGGTLMTDSGWKNMALTNGAKADIARYRLLNGIVYIEVLNVVADVGSIFFTLPSAYMPSHNIWQTWFSAGKFGNFLVTDKGQVSRASSTTSGTDSGTKASFEVSYPID